MDRISCVKEERASWIRRNYEAIWEEVKDDKEGVGEEVHQVEWTTLWEEEDEG